VSEIDWITPLGVLVAGLLVGLALAVFRSGGGDDPTTDARLEDLRREKDRLLQALRDLQDSRTGEATADERAGLEARAAQVLRLIEEEAPKAAAKTAATATTAKPRAAVPSGGAVGSELKGALKGGLVVGFAAILAFVLMNGTSERKDGMSITGGTPQTTTGEVTVQVPSAGETGGTTSGVPPNLQPKPSEAVDRARALVASDPGTLQHWSDLGYALLDAEGWIDAWSVSEEIEKRVPGHPDGLVISAMVRIAMGQPDKAAELLDDALKASPDHLMGLTYRGMLAAQTGDLAGTKEHWGRARDLASDPQDKAAFEELIVRAETGRIPSGASVPGHPGAAGRPARPGAAGAPAHPGTADPSATASSGGGEAIEGTITLAEGAQPPPGGVLFVIARHKGVTRGPPAATKRMLAQSFPVSFILDESNVMMGGPFPDEVDLSVRLDADGDAMTKEAADLNGSAGTVKAGTTNVVIELTGS
jgi:tetratricopeptide (TPR) repeat protein